MNGRVYDPALGRMLSPDPILQAPTNSQNYNRYTYALNNPLKYTDPSGYLIVESETVDYRDQINVAGVYGYNENVLSSLFNSSGGLFLSGSDAWMAAVAETMIKAEAAAQEDEKKKKEKEKKKADKGTKKEKDKNKKEKDKEKNDQESEEEAEGAAAPVDGQNGGGNPPGGSAMATVAPIALTAAAIDGPLPIGDVIGGIALAGAVAYDATQRVFVTYTMTNGSGQTYVGRTSGYGSPHGIMMRRASGHHMRAFGFGTPVLDRAVQGVTSYPAMRGREQQMIDFYGGVGSPNVGNRIRGVGTYNPAGRVYHGASNLYFGPLHNYTGF